MYHLVHVHLPCTRMVHISVFQSNSFFHDFDGLSGTVLTVHRFLRVVKISYITAK